MNPKSSFITVIIFMFAAGIASAQQSVVINEIMYAPLTGKPEWIELYNPTTEAVSIQGWILYDPSAARPVITNDPISIPPGGYIVISKDATILNEFPTLAGKLIVMDKLPSLNNTGDDITLARPDTSTVELIQYKSSWGGQSGKSLERIDALLPGNDQSNWTTSLSPNFATPGARNSVTLMDYDLAVEGLVLQPQFPRIGDNVIIGITVRNRGAREADFFSAALFEDLNKDGQADPGELVFSVSSTAPLAPNNTVILNGLLPSSVESDRVVIARVDYAQDENAFNNTRLDTVRYGYAASSVIINEFMYTPVSGEPEWVELLNTTGASIDIAGWKIGDNSSFKEISGANTTLPPNGYLVISSSASIVDYHTSIPSPIVTVSIPALNNGGDDVRLIDKTGFTMDSLQYTPDWGGADGKSVERINPAAPSTKRSNWAASYDPERSTPGRKNSNAIEDFDLALTSGYVSGKSIYLTVQNVGLKLANGASLALFRDMNGDSVTTANERATDRSIPALSPSDSVQIIFQDVLTDAGMVLYIAVIEYPSDQRLRNNTRFISTFTEFPSGVLAINEIMYAPLTNDAEWIEYINTSDRAIDVQGFKIADQPGSDGKRSLIPLPQSSLPVPAQGYLVIASDSSIFKRYVYLLENAADRIVVVVGKSSLNLNNTIDEVVLIDPTGKTIDSVRYDDAWHNPNVTATTGFSLERLNPDFPADRSYNWSTTANPIGGTPGLRNSLFTRKPPLAIGGGISLEFSPNPFSPDNDGHEDFCVISYALSANISQIRLRVFDTQGRLVRTVANSVPAGSQGQIIWDGLDDGKQRLRVGMYVVLLEALDINNNAVEAKKGVVVIATKL